MTIAAVLDGASRAEAAKAGGPAVHGGQACRASSYLDQTKPILDAVEPSPDPLHLGAHARNIERVSA